MTTADAILFGEFRSQTKLGESAFKWRTFINNDKLNLDKYFEHEGWCGAEGWAIRRPHLPVQLVEEHVPSPVSDTVGVSLLIIDDSNNNTKDCKLSTGRVSDEQIYTFIGECGDTTFEVSADQVRAIEQLLGWERSYFWQYQLHHQQLRLVNKEKNQVLGVIFVANEDITIQKS